MAFGDLLVYAALASLAASTAAAGVAWRRPARAARARPQAQRFLWLSALFFAAAVAVLVEAFLTSRLVYQYVWANTHTSYPWWQRLAGLWAGREGSLMLWMLWLLLVLAAAELVSWRKESRHLRASRPFEEPPSRAAARFVAGLALLAFFAILLTWEPFAPVDAGSLAAQPQGRGLNPQLVTVLMAIHPPILFLGYALTIIPFAAASGYMLTNDRRWTEYSRPWSYLAFFALTLGVGLGGLWAYIALGWGGYWAWDPVEVASTVPWLFIAMFLHAQMRHADAREFKAAAPLIGYLAFPGSLFATFVTRAGGVWISVHNFLGSRFSPSPVQRLRIALTDTPENAGYFALFLVLLVAGLVMLWRHMHRLEREATPAPQPDGGEPLPRTWGDRLAGWLRMPALFTAAVMLFALAATVVLTLMIVAINGFSSDVQRIHVYETRVGIVAMGMMTLLALTLTLLLVKKRALAVGITGAALALSALGALAFESQRALAAALPVLGLVVASAAGMVTRAFRRRGIGAFRLASMHTVHLGAALLLVGYGFSSTVDEEFPVLELTEGQTKTYKDIAVTLDDIAVEDPDGDGVADTITPRLSVAKGGESLGAENPSFGYFLWFGPTGYYRPNVAILSLWTTDIYLTPRGFYDEGQGWVYANLPLFDQGKQPASTDVSGVAVEVSLLPFVRLLWLGWGLMLLGIALRLAAYAVESDRRSKRLWTAAPSPAA